MGRTALGPAVAEGELVETIEAARSGDRDAANRLIVFIERDLFRFCVYLTGGGPLAEDLCQDALIKALTSLKSLHEPRRFKGWVFQTVKNLFFDHVRSAKNAAYVPIEDIEQSARIENPADMELTVQIRRALARMDPQDRFIVILVDLQEFAQSEAAEILGITVEALRSRLRRARAQFIEIYEEK